MDLMEIYKEYEELVWVYESFDEEDAEEFLRLTAQQAEQEKIVSKQKAITVKEIKGACIKTIPIGTEFMVKTIKSKYGYSTCYGLNINQIWNDEYKLIEGERKWEN